MAEIDFARGMAAATETLEQYADIFLPGGRDMEGPAGEAWGALYHGYRDVRHACRRYVAIYDDAKRLETAVPDELFTDATCDLFDYLIGRLEMDMDAAYQKIHALCEAAKAFAPRDPEEDEDQSYP
jgi:hypothetical protein